MTNLTQVRELEYSRVEFILLNLFLIFLLNKQHITHGCCKSFLLAFIFLQQGIYTRPRLESRPQRSQQIQNGQHSVMLQAIFGIASLWIGCYQYPIHQEMKRDSDLSGNQHQFGRGSSVQAVLSKIGIPVASVTLTPSALPPLYRNVALSQY